MRGQVWNSFPFIATSSGSLRSPPSPQGEGFGAAQINITYHFNDTAAGRKTQGEKTSGQQSIGIKGVFTKLFPNVKKLLQIQGNLGVNALQICVKII